MIKKLWTKICWYSRKLLNFVYAIMTDTLLFEGVNAPSGLKPEDLANADIIYTAGGQKVLRLTLKNGEVFNLSVTDLNIATLKKYIKILILDEDLTFQFYNIPTSKLKP